MHVQTVLVDTSWLHSVWEMFLLFIKFKFLWKNDVSEKIKARPSTSSITKAPTFLILFEKIVSLTPI